MINKRSTTLTAFFLYFYACNKTTLSNIDQDQLKTNHFLLTSHLHNKWQLACLVITSDQIQSYYNTDQWK